MLRIIKYLYISLLKDLIFNRWQLFNRFYFYTNLQIQSFEADKSLHLSALDKIPYNQVEASAIWTNSSNPFLFHEDHICVKHKQWW